MPSNPSAPPRPVVVEVVDEEMARVFAAKSGAEQLAIAAAMFRSARRMIDSHLRAQHPDWEAHRIEAETARRLAHGTG